MRATTPTIRARSRLRTLPLLLAALSLILTGFGPVGTAGAAPDEYARTPEHLVDVVRGTDLGRFGSYEGPDRTGTSLNAGSSPACTATDVVEGGTQLLVASVCHWNPGGQLSELDLQWIDLATYETVRQTETRLLAGGSIMLEDFGGITLHEGSVYILSGVKQGSVRVDEPLMRVDRISVEAPTTDREFAEIPAQAFAYDGPAIEPAIAAVRAFPKGSSQMVFRGDVLNIHTNVAWDYEGWYAGVTVEMPSDLADVGPATISTNIASFAPFSVKQLAAATDQGRDLIIVDHATIDPLEISAAFLPGGDMWDAVRLRAMTLSAYASSENNGATLGDMAVSGDFTAVVGRAAPTPAHGIHDNWRFNAVNDAGQNTSNIWLATANHQTAMAKMDFQWVTDNHPLTSQTIVHEPTVTAMPGGDFAVLYTVDDTEVREVTTHLMRFAPDGNLRVHVRYPGVWHLPVAEPVVAGGKLLWVGAPDRSAAGMKRTQLFALDLQNTAGYPLDTVAERPFDGVPSLEVDAEYYDVAGAQRLRPHQTLTAKPSGPFTPSAELSYQWKRNQVPIPGATDPTYTLTWEDANTMIAVEATANRAHYTPESIMWQAHRSVGIGEFDASADPVIKGDARTGGTLSVDMSQWVPQPTSVTYEWQRNGVVTGTQSTYTLVPSDVGTSLTVTVTATHPNCLRTTKTSAAITPELGLLRLEQGPKIQGGTRVGDTIRGTAASGWAPAPDVITRVWLREGRPIEGTEGLLTYTLTPADVGSRLLLEECATKRGYDDHCVVSDWFGPVEAVAITHEGDFSIRGYPAYGRTLSVNGGTWTPSDVSLSYEWMRNGVVTGMQPTYRVVASDIGADLTVKVTATHPDFPTVSKTSEIRLGVPATFTRDELPTLSGEAIVGRTLTVKPGAWTPAPDQVAYEWSRDGETIAGQTGPTYTLTEADWGRRITATERVSKTNYANHAASAGTTEVVRKAFVDPPTPVIEGSIRSGQLLTAKPGVWPEGTTLAYQWIVDGNDVPAATGVTFTPLPEHIGLPIQVRVSGTHAKYMPAMVKSALISNVGLPTAQRIMGKSRVETAVAVSQKSHKDGDGGAVIVTTGWNYPDSLAATPFAAKLRAPLLLTERDVLPVPTVEEIQRIKPNEIIVLGGSVAVSDSVVAALGEIDGVDADVRRISGKSRYETAEMIVREGWGSPGVDEAFVATGEHFADALAAGAAAAAKDIPVVLVNGKESAASSSSIKLLDDLGVRSVRIAGGEVAISKGIEQTILPGLSPMRYKGRSRYDTAAKIADDFHLMHGNAYVATGEHFADALSGGVLAGLQGAPLVLAQKECQPQATNTHLLEKVKPAQVFVLGGSVAIDDAVLQHSVCK